MITVANAPCSYGAFEITVGIDPLVPPALALLDDVANAGYAGIDLGPLGYLGIGDELAERLRTRNLTLAGGYFAVPFSDPSQLPQELERLDELLDTFDAASSGIGRRREHAEAETHNRGRRLGQPLRVPRPSGRGPEPRLGRRRLAPVRRCSSPQIVARCRERGYEPTFHPHTATYIEAPWEIDRLLELSDIGVCLDTGHLLLGGGDPVSAVDSWRGRINHLHLKDARIDVIQEIIRESAPVEEIWRRRAFCRLGDGDVALDRVLEELRGVDYDGWLIVEQDILPDADEGAEAPAKDQAANREWLRARGL